MAVYDNFEDYQEEIELSCVQNYGVEIELYSIIAAIIRECCPNISLRDVSARRSTRKDEEDYKSPAGFPDFVVLERSFDEPSILGCVEAKNTYEIYSDHQKQIRLHLQKYKKVLFTNGLHWKLLTGENEEIIWEYELGYREGEKPAGRKKRDSIIWNDNHAWDALINAIRATGDWSI